MDADSPSLTRIFTYQDMPVRITTHTQQTWFCNKDVCAVLDIRNHKDAYSSLDDDEKMNINTDSAGGIQKTGFVSESGLYELIFKSRKSEAKAFRKWISSQVLPSIRKTGSYTLEEHERTKFLTDISNLENSKKQIEEQKLKAEKCLEQISEEKKKIEQDLKQTDEDKKQTENQLHIIDAENNHITILHENMKKKKIRFKCQKGPCVYLEKNSLIENYVKIGFTGNLQERLAYYETSQPVRSNLVYAIFCEDAKIVEDFMKAKYKNRAPNKEWVSDIEIDILRIDLISLVKQISGNEFTELTEEDIQKKWKHLIGSRRWEVKNPTSEKSATRIQNLIGETKKCARCNEEKSKDEFGKDKVRTDGLSCYCKPCKSAKTKEYGKKFREEKENSEQDGELTIQEKKCTKCEETLPLDNFHNKTGSKDEKQPICKACVNDAKKQSRLKHKGEEHQCPQCEKTYKLKDSLTRHVKQDHSKSETSQITT